MIKNKSSNIVLPNLEKSGYVAYGDDSQYKDILVYAFVIISKENLEKISKKIKAIKDNYDVPTLHCKILFNKNAKLKNSMEHITESDAKNIIKKIVKLINETPIFLNYSYSTLSTWLEYAKKIRNVVTLSNADNSIALEQPFNPTPKAILGLLALASQSIPPRDIRIPPLYECISSICQDGTKTEFFGKLKKQAHNWAKGFSDINAPAGQIFYLEPKIEAYGYNSPMLEIADIAAYICSHSLGTTRTLFFTEQLKKIKIWHRNHFVPS